MKNKLIYVMIGCLFAFSFAFFVYQIHLHSVKAVQTAIQNKSFLAGLSYTKASRPFFSEQTVLSDVTFVAYPAIRTIDKVKFGPVSSGAYEIEALHAQINLHDLILENEPSKAVLLKHLKDYIPYQDWVRQPLLTLLLISPQTVDMTALLTIKPMPQANKALIQGKIQAAHLFTLFFSTEAAHLPKDFTDRVLDTLMNKDADGLDGISFGPVAYTWTDNGFYERYNAYLKTLPPAFVKECQDRNPALYEKTKQRIHTGTLSADRLRQKLKMIFYSTAKTNK